MEKEELLSKIGAVIGNPDDAGNYGEIGISSRTLDAYVDAILPTLGESVSDEQINSFTSVLKAMGGQLRHEKAEFVKNYKPQQKQPANTSDDSGKLLDKLNQIISDNQALKTRLDLKDSEEKQKSLKASVINGMKAKNATDEYVLKNCLKGIVFDDKKSVDELVNECLSLYDAEYTEARGAGLNPRNGGGGSNGDNSDLDAFFSEMKKRGKF